MSAGRTGGCSGVAHEMDALGHLVQSMHAHGRALRFRDAVRGKVLASPLVQGCAAWGAEGDRYARALFGGFWSFVDAFPSIIRDTRATLPAAAFDALRRSLHREAVGGMLRGMESDEHVHRGLWIRSASCVGLTEAELQQWPVLPEIRTITETLRTERHLAHRLLYFVAVEVIAAEVSGSLLQAPRFAEAMGDEGSRWFAAHVVAPGATTTHEAVAYALAVALLDAAGEPGDDASLGEPVQRCVDWFFAGSVACVRAFVAPPLP